jgi:hypothetical protein
MASTDPLVQAWLKAREEGRFEDMLRMLQEAMRAGDAGTPLPGMSVFITMFNWELLIKDYAPARAALIALRDEYTQRLLAGDDDFPSVNRYLAPSRFKIIAEMNESLGDEGATHALFVQMESRSADAARRNAIFALPAIVAAGGFALAERYLPDPLRQVPRLNATAKDWPLYPPPHQAPRLAAELSGIMKAVHMRAAALDGLGRADEARALREAALAGIDAEELRIAAARELAAPGAINRELTERQMAAYDAAQHT